MTITQILLYIILPIILIGTGIIVLLKRQAEKVKLPSDDIIKLFDKNNITNVEYIRNKIVVSCVDYKLFDIDTLKSLGATGINIVGNKIKFYFKEDANTKQLFDQLKLHLEG